MKTHNAISNIAGHSKMFFLSSVYYKNISLALSTSSILHTWSFFFFFQNNLHFFTYIVECFIQTHLISHSFLYVYRHLFFCFVLPFIRLLISCVCNTERNSYDAYIYCPKKTEVKRNRSKVWQQCTPLRILTAIQHSSRFSYSSSRLICIKSFPF